MAHIKYMKPLEKIAVKAFVRVGALSPDTEQLPARASSAVYMLRLDLTEYVNDIIGDDISPAAQKIRAQLRKM